MLCYWENLTNAQSGQLPLEAGIPPLFYNFTFPHWPYKLKCFCFKDSGKNIVFVHHYLEPFFPNDLHVETLLTGCWKEQNPNHVTSPLRKLQRAFSNHGQRYTKLGEKKLGSEIVKVQPLGPNLPCKCVLSDSQFLFFFVVSISKLRFFT